MDLTRRTFLATAAAAGSVFPTPAVLGANKTKRFRTALVGCGWWGKNILNVAIEAGQSEVVGLADVDENQLDGAAKEVEKRSGGAPRRFKDFRELFEKTKPEIVIVGTPDHWHPLVTIAACRVGAHVYVEKPICHTINEGKAMVKAARETGRTVQVGTHRRMSPHNISAREFIRAGKLGKIGMARAFVHYGGNAGTPTPDSDPPKGLDWDFWCGPAPLRPFNAKIHPRGFRQFLDYANGQLGDWGIHWMDQILWCMDATAPKRVYSTGGRHIRRDNTDAPDTQLASFQFDDFTVTWEHRYFAANNAEKHNVGVYFYGTEGTLHLGWLDGWTFYPTNKKAAEIHAEPKLHKPDEQSIPELWADFLDAIRTGRRPVCDIELGHRSTTMSLLAMLSMKLGRSVDWDGQKQLCQGDAEANKLLQRPYRGPWQYPQS